MKKDQKTDYHWAKQVMAEDCQVISCPEHDPIKDFKRDPSGYYVLIRVNFEVVRIEVAICDKDHRVRQIFSGRSAVDIYHAILSYEKKHHLPWFKEKTHLAYLGKELKKAEIALTLGQTSYFQE